MVNKEIAERLTVARISMLMRMPFWGNLATRLRLIEEISDWLPTAATDGRAIYYNPEFIKPLTDKNIVFLLCHEVLHVVFEHIGRCNDLTHDKTLSNLAADFAVNQVLVDDKIGEQIGSPISVNDLLTFDKENPKSGTLYDPMFKGWSYEQIYDHLQQHKDELKKNLGGFEFTIHIDGSGGDDENSGKPKLSPEELREIQDMMREAVLSAAQSCNAGDVPLGIQRMIKNLVSPKMDWRELLTERIDSQVKNDYTYMKLGRRSFSSDLIFPSQMKQPKIKVYLALDMSGSIGEEEIRDFFSEVAGIVQQFSAFEIHIVCFDTAAHNYQVFTEDNVTDLFEYEPKGGGGTAPNSVYEFFKDNEIVPEQLVFFTDGEVFGDWGDSEYCETLWIIKNHREIEASHGTSVMYQ